jgi:hypothetical protein
MGWATKHIEALNRGETVQFRPRGASMRPKIQPNQLCTVEPVDPDTELHVGDIVLCRVKGREYLHLIKAKRKGSYQIGNNRGGINGWIGPHSIYGRLVRVEGKGLKYVNMRVRDIVGKPGKTEVRCVCGKVYVVDDPKEGESKSYSCPEKCGHGIRLINKPRKK